MALTVATANSVLPLSLADAKSHIRSLSTDEDDLITDYIWSAANYLEQRTGLSILNATFDETFREWSDTIMRLGKSPLSSVTSVKYRDGDSVEQTWAATNYLAHTPTTTRGWIELSPSATLPSMDTREYPWTVRYVAGFGAAATSTPDAIKHAIRLLVEEFDRFRGAMVTGTISTPTAVTLDRLLSMVGPGVL